MRVGLFTEAYYPIISGVSISVDTLANELRKLGHTVYIFCNDHDDAVSNDFVIRMGGKKLPMKGLQEYRIGKVTKKKVKSIGALNLDIIHCHTEFTMGRLGRAVARKYNLPLVHTYHTMYEDYVHFVSKMLAKPLRFLSKVYSKSFANKADKVIFPTIKVKQTFDRYGYKKDSEIIPTGIYIDNFKQINANELNKIRSSIGLPKNVFTLLFLGRMSREKNVVIMLEEIKTLMNKYDDVMMLMVGDGPDREMFEQIVEDANLSDRFIFTKMIPPKDVKYYYHLSDLFINFSVTETQGLTYIEALTSSVPLLVRYDDNLQDVIEQGKNGFTFYRNEEFLPYFDMIYSNPDMYKKMVSRASESMEYFSAQNYAKRIETIYNDLL